MSEQNVKFVFFGSSEISVVVLDELKNQGFIPKLIVAPLDAPKGRKLILTPPETKVWAEKNNIPCVQFKSLKSPEVSEEILSYSKEGFDLFLVVSYGKLIPKNILDIPKYKTLNLHPSLLPKLRGPSPIISAILSENETGISIMRLDEEMDHGPLIAQQKIDIEWPPYEEELEKVSGKVGADLLAQVIPDWINGKIAEIPQKHEDATYCEKVTKTQGEINLNDPAEMNLRKIRAYHRTPTAYYFVERNGKKTRVLIKKAHIENNELILERVVPEGKKEMSYTDFKKGERN